jgi:hypothetical protein
MKQESPNHFIKNGNLFFIQSKENLDIHDKLPPKNFIVKYNEMGDKYYLEGVEEFELPSVLYGKIVRQSERIFETFKKRPLSTGVFLEGEKGSGKTLLAKVLSRKMAESLAGPTLIINQPYVGDTFNKFIQDITQPCAILFDEFEKVYHEIEDQNYILTLLDGVFPSKKLFLLTCNDKYKVNNHMKNRPGRLFYMLSFDGLDREFIIEYCERTLKQSLLHHIPQVVTISKNIEKFNFDMLKSLVEEMNRYDESPKESIEMLNIKPDEFTQTQYFITVTAPDGHEIPKEELHTNQWRGNLNAPEYYIELYWYNKKDPENKGKRNRNQMNETYITVTNNDFVMYEPESRTVVFKTEEGFIVKLNKKEVVNHMAHYSDFSKYL